MGTVWRSWDASSSCRQKGIKPPTPNPKLLSRIEKTTSPSSSRQISWYMKGCRIKGIGPIIPNSKHPQRPRKCHSTPRLAGKPSCHHGISSRATRDVCICRSWAAASGATVQAEGKQSILFKPKQRTSQKKRQGNGAKRGRLEHL